MDSFRIERAAGLIVFLSLIPVAAIYGQAPVCPVPIPRDTVSFVDSLWSRRFGPAQLPILTPAIDATDVLARVPGSFHYDLGVPGWNDGWSLMGVAPHEISMRIEGVPHRDLFTGAPRWELLPFDLLELLHSGVIGTDNPVSVGARYRSFANARPYTELRYRTGGGLQAITGLHQQRRPLKLFGKQGIIQILGSYGGRGATGAYPASRLRRERKLYGRFRYERDSTIIELSGLSVRHQVLLHSGVLPYPGLGFESVFVPFGARVATPGRFQQTNRGDLRLRLQSRLTPLAPRTDLTLFRIGQTGHYYNTIDTLTARAWEWGFVGRQPLFRNGPAIKGEAWFDEVAGFGPDHRSTTVAVALADSIQLGAWQATIEAGGRQAAGVVRPTIGLGVASSRGKIRPFAEGALFSRESMVLNAWTGDQHAGQDRKVVTGSSVRTGIMLEWKTFDVMAYGFVTERSAVVDAALVPGTARDTLQLLPDQAGASSGGVLEAGWRRSARGGLYAMASSTYLTGGADTARLPDLSGMGRLGARFRLFKGDLDVDAYVLGRYWTAFRSRSLHLPTGMLVLDRPDDPGVSSGGLVDLYAEMRIRDATVFLSYENVLGGTVITPGTMFVPVYPLASQVFRIGVYWPIMD